MVDRGVGLQDSFCMGVLGFPVALGWLFLGKMGKYATGIGNSLGWHRGSRKGCRQIGRYLFLFGKKNIQLEKSRIGEVVFLDILVL